MRRLSAFLVILCVSTSALAATSVTKLVSQYGELKAGTTHAASDLTITVGHMTFTGSGTATVMNAGDQPFGILLNGGTFTYELANRDELAAVRYNAKHGEVKLTTNGDKTVVTEPFKTALIVGNGLPALTGAAAPASDWSSHRELFAKNAFVAPAAHLFAYAALNAPAARVVRAEINASSKPYVYTYDDALTRNETLVYLRYPQVRSSRLGDALWERPFSKQAIGRANREAPPSRIRLTDVDVNLVGKLNEEGNLTVVETLVPQKRPAAAIHFDLQKYIWWDAHREPRRFNLRKVVDGEGNSLEFVHEMDDLVVALAKPAPANQPLKLKFEIDGNFLYRHEKTNFWELGITPWFPWVQMHDQRYTFHSVVKVEKPFVVFASGKTIRRVDEGDYHVVETKLDQPSRWVSILAGKYQFDEETKNGVTVRVASFIAKNTDAFRKLRNIAFSAIEYYPTFLGPFPYEELNVIEKTDAFGYGQAPAGIVFITSEAFSPKLGDANYFVEGVNMRFAHEIAHAYWGGAVSMPTLEDQWIDEAFAEYSAALFMKAAKKNEYDKAFIRWKDEAKRFNENATIPTANRIHHPGDPIGWQMARASLLYAKGAYLLAALHSELGDQTFLTFLKSYQKSLRYKETSTKDVIDLLQFLTKKDYGPWFEANFYAAGFPDFAKPK
jgi:Peptidase family M1 domain